MKQLLLAILLAFPAIAFSDKNGDSCQYIGSWLGYDSSGEIAWTSQANGMSSSKGTILLELPGFDITFGGLFDVINQTSNLKGAWKRTGGNTFIYAGVGFAYNSDGETVWAARLTGEATVVGECDVLALENTWLSIYAVNYDTDPIPIWTRDPDIGPLPFAPHEGYRVKVDLPQ